MPTVPVAMVAMIVAGVVTTVGVIVPVLVGEGAGGVRNVVVGHRLCAFRIRLFRVSLGCRAARSRSLR